jgi:hypothetical protein
LTRILDCHTRDANAIMLVCYFSIRQTTGDYL